MSLIYGLMFVGLNIFNVIDAITTKQIIEIKGIQQELNPIGRYLFSIWDPSVVVFTKIIVIFLLSLYIYYRILTLEKGVARTAHICVFVFLFALYLFVATSNYLGWRVL